MQCSVALGFAALAVGDVRIGGDVTVRKWVPTARPVDPGKGFFSADLPGGRAAQVLHIGSYDSMQQTYGQLMGWLGEQGL